MNSLTKEQFENLCQQSSEARELFSSSQFNYCFNLPSEFQKKLVKKNQREITHEGILYSFWGIFSGCVALALFSVPFQMWDDVSKRGIRSFTDVFFILILFGIFYGIGSGFFYIFYDRFISKKSHYLRSCLVNGDFTVQECIPIGYAEYGTTANSKNSVGYARVFVVLKDSNENIYVFEDDYIAFVKNVKKSENAFLIKVDNIGKKKETETFVICY